MRKKNESHMSKISWLLFLSLIVSCKGPVAKEVAVIPSDEILWSLGLNYSAANISMTEGTNTLQLVATAYNAFGQPIADVPEVQFKALDSVISVTPEGLVKARYVSRVNTSGRVEARIVYRGITRTATARIRVSQQPHSSPLHTLSLVPPAGDSTKQARRGLNTEMGRQTAITLLDSDNNPYPDLLIGYQLIEKGGKAAISATGVLTGLLPGKVLIKATAMAYGIEKTDSIEYTITEKVFATFTLFNLEVANGAYRMFLMDDYFRTHYIHAGGTIVWSNLSQDTADIVFDDPSAAHKGSPVGSTLPDTSGNIPLLVGSVDQGQKLRSFKVPGRYRWTSTRNPGISGEIIVTEY